MPVTFHILKAVMEAARQHGPLSADELTLIVAELNATEPLPQISAELVREAETESAAHAQSMLARVLPSIKAFVALSVYARQVVDDIITKSGQQLEAAQRDELIDLFQRARMCNSVKTGAPLVPALPANAGPQGM